mmetsp:Transcript_7641/g.17430  ORF Transcript_7641/g.17430 Transcript_7641/m.17430 type:complete len:214 (-) Transcript_7641:131-772(-)
MTSNENVSPSILNRLIKEVQEYTKNPVSDIRLQVNEENVTDIRAELIGPEETPYHGGFFEIKLLFGPDFPAVPPKGFFLTPIFHPNVSKTGEICVNTLKKDWKSDCKLSHILMVIRCLLIEPNPESALNEEAGRMFMEDYESYAQRARLITGVHAMRNRDSVGKQTVHMESKESEDAIADIDVNSKVTKRSQVVKDKAIEKKRMDKKRSLKRL